MRLSFMAVLYQIPRSGARRVSRILCYPIIHLSNQPGILESPFGASPDGPPVDPLFDLAPRWACRARALRRAGGLLPRLFHHHPFRGCLFSVALSVARAFPAPLAHYRRNLRPVESGLSSALRRRSVRRAPLRDKFKDQSRYRIRPHIVQATSPELWSTSCATLGG